MIMGLKLLIEEGGIFWNKMAITMGNYEERSPERYKNAI